MLEFNDNISITTSWGSGYDVLVEWKRYKDDDNKEIDDGADSTHSFRNLFLVYFRHVLPLQASLHKCWSKPSYHGIWCCVCNPAECKGGDERFPITTEGICDDGEWCKGKGQETECLCERQSGRRWGAHGWIPDHHSVGSGGKSAGWEEGLDVERNFVTRLQTRLTIRVLRNSGSINLH